MTMNRFIRLILGLLLIAGATGCVRIKTNITGTVTREGQPLVWTSEMGHLHVVFHPDGETNMSPVKATKTDWRTGTYEIAEIPAGKYRIAVQQFDERHNDAFGGRLDAVRTIFHCEVVEDGQVINIDIPKDLPPKN